MRRSGLVGAAVVLAGAAACSGKVQVQPPDGSSGSSQGGSTVSAGGRMSTTGAGAHSVAGASGSASNNGGASNSGGASNDGGAGAAGDIGAGGMPNGAGGMLDHGPFPPNADGQCVLNSSKHTDGLCYCQPSLLSHCPDACVDPTTDGEHCGTCTNQCGPTVACIDSQCGHVPTLLASAPIGCNGMRLALSGNALYYTDAGHGVVNRVALPGGAITPVAQNQNAPTLLTVRGDSVFWVASGEHAIYRAQNGVVTRLAHPPAAVNGFTVDDAVAMLYYSSETTVFGTPLGVAGDGPVGMEMGGIPQALAMFDHYLVFPTDIDGNVDVIDVQGTSVATCGGPASEQFSKCVRIARSQGSLDFSEIAFVAGQVIFADGSQIRVSTASAARPVAVNVAQADSFFSTFTVANGSVYAADGEGHIVTARLAMAPDGPTVALARGQAPSTAIVADAQRVYWATDKCQIMSLPL